MKNRLCVALTQCGNNANLNTVELEKIQRRGQMVRFVRIKKFAELTGYTVSAVEGKIAKGVFIEGAHYRRAPDSNICIDLEAYEKWVEGEARQGLSRSGLPSASASRGRESAVTKR